MNQISQMRPQHGDEVIVQWEDDDEEGSKKARKALKKLLKTPGVAVFEVVTETKNVSHSRRGRQIRDSKEFKKGQSYLGTPALAGG